MSDNIVELTDTNFDTEVLQSSTPVLVDFWAPWCGPCRALAPTVHDLANEMAGKIKVGKLNVDDAGNTASRYNVRGIPTLLVFQAGQVKEQLVGNQPKDTIMKALSKYVPAVV